jgi:hypothetical protein
MPNIQDNYKNLLVFLVKLILKQAMAGDVFPFFPVGEGVI